GGVRGDPSSDDDVVATVLDLGHRQLLHRRDDSPSTVSPAGAGDNGSADGAAGASTAVSASAACAACSAVVSPPSVRRTEDCASCAGIPRASRTGLGSSLPAAQAEPLEAVTPRRSRSSSTDSPLRPGT